MSILKLVPAKELPGSACKSFASSLSHGLGQVSVNTAPEGRICMFGIADGTHSWFGPVGICHLAFFGALFLFQPSLRGQTFKAESYQANTKTAGIQEAIDAAAKAGGTVQIPAGTFILHAAPGHPAILLRSRVNLVGAGAGRTILKLEANLKVYPSVLANQ